MPDAGLDYFPVSPKVYRIYEVEETTYVNRIETVDTYLLREYVFDSLLNGQEKTYLMRIERFNSVSEIWESIESIAIRRTNQMVEYRAGNVPFVKLTFPVRSGRTWDGNALNTDSEAIYSYENLDDETPFDNSEHIKVVISDLPANIVEQDQRSEVYAQGIGLVERDFVQILFCQQGCSFVNEPEDGTILSQRLIEYGEF